MMSGALLGEEVARAGGESVMEGEEAIDVAVNRLFGLEKATPRAGPLVWGLRNFN